MAKYFTDFSEYTTGVAPSDWSEHGAGGAGTVIDSSLPAGYTGTKVLSSTTLRMKWDTVGVISGDTHMIARFRRTATPSTNCTRLTIFGDDTGGTNYYFSSPASSNLQIAKFVASTSSTIGSTVPFSWAGNTWYYIELQIVGTTLRARAWNEGDAVPDWMITGTDTSLTTGWVGIFDTQSGTTYTDWVGVGTNGDTAPTSLADLNDAPTFSVQPSVDYGAGVALTPSNTPVTINFTPADADGDTITWDLVGNYPASPTVLDSGSTAAGVADSVSLAYSNAFFAGVDGDYALRVIISDGTAADVVSDEFFVSRASPPSTPPGTYVIRFNPTDILSTDADELSWEIRTAASGGGNLIASGDATSGVLEETSPITDAYLTNGTNTRYLRVFDGAGNVDEESFVVEANLIEEHFHEYTVQVNAGVVFDRQAALTRTHTTTTSSALTMVRNLTLWFVLMVAAALTTSKHFVRQTLSTVSGNVLSTSLVQRYREWVINTSAVVSLDSLTSRFKSYVVQVTASAQMQQARSFFRSYLITPSTTVLHTLRRGVSVTYLVTTQPSVTMSRLATLSRTFVVQTAKAIHRDITTSAFILRTFLVKGRTSIQSTRVLNISAIYTIAVQAGVSVRRGISWLFTLQVPVSVRTLREFFKNFTTYVHAGVTHSAPAQRFHAYLVSTSAALAYVRGVGVTLTHLVTTSAAVKAFRASLLSFVVQAGSSVAMLRNLSLWKRTTASSSVAMSKLASFYRTFVITTRAALQHAVGSVLEKIFRVRTSSPVHMTRHITYTMRVVVTAATALSHFLRKVRDYWSTYITQEIEWTTTAISQVESEFTFILLPDEWGTTLYADGVLQAQAP